MTKITKQEISTLQSFKLLLISQNIGQGTIRSYLSDTRHFLAWYESHLQASHLQTPTFVESIGLIKKRTVDQYFEYLVENHIPRQTVNRRLSTLRKFGAFCVSQGWLIDNYFSYLKNLTTSQTQAEDKYSLNDFRQKLITNGNSAQTIKSYLSDVRHFINWHACHPDALPAGRQENRDL